MHQSRKLLLALFTLPVLLLAAHAEAAEPASRLISTPSPQPAVPNLTGQFSHRLLSQLVNMPVENTTQIRDNILGTYVQGTAYTTGYVFPLLVPSADRGVLQLRFAGTSRSPQLVGRNGPATIYSSAVTNSQMYKTIVFDDKGIRHLPTEGQAQTNVSINGVSAQRRLVQRIARRRANEARGQAQAATSARTKSQLKVEIEKQAKEPLLTLQDYFIHEFQEPLKEKGALPKLLRFSTTASQLNLAIQQLGRSPMPQPTATPTLDPRHDLSFAFHTSALNSLYEVYYAGEKVRDKDWLQTMDTFTGDEPEQLIIEDETPRWSVVMADVRPLDLSFESTGITITLHIKSLKLGEKELEGKFTVTAHYQLEKTATGPQTRREGDVEATAELTTGTPEDQQEAIKLLAYKFSGVFLPTISLEGVSPPSDDLWSKLVNLSLTQLTANDGWLVAGYQLPTPKVQLASNTKSTGTVSSTGTVRTASTTQPAPVSTPHITKQHVDAAEQWLTTNSTKYPAAKRALPYFKRARGGSCH